MNDPPLQVVATVAVEIAFVVSVLGAARVLLTWRKRSNLSLVLAAAILLDAAALVVWSIDWFNSGCSDTPGCGWADGGVVLLSIWGGLVIASVVYLALGRDRQPQGH